MTTQTESSNVAKGLKGVKVADSSICLVNGTEGRLLYRGYDIDDLANHGTFEEVAYLLFKGELPDKTELAEFKKSLAREAALPGPVLEFLKTLPKSVLPMSALRSAVSVAGIYDPQAEDESMEGQYQKSIRLTAQMATLVAAIRRHRDGKEPVAPKPELGFAANLMSMLNGTEPTPDAAKAMDLILILHAEHGLNASTFAARVIIATLTDIYSAVTGAIGSLKGKLHGGANTEVLKTLMEVGSVENIEPWVKEVRANKGKFMGFGHAVYQTEDPRAKHLKVYSQKVCQEIGEPKWYEMSVEMEKRVYAEIQRHCNVDFYSASLQHAMGIPGDLFTGIFAASRIVGWCAHILEQLADNKIIRPSANYVGERNRQYVPIAER